MHAASSSLASIDPSADAVTDTKRQGAASHLDRTDKEAKSSLVKWTEVYQEEIEDRHIGAGDDSARRTVQSDEP